MQIEVVENQPIAPHTTFRMGGNARFFAVLRNASEIPEVMAFAESRNLKLLFIGGGSNVIFPDNDIEYLFVKIEILGFEVIDDTIDSTTIKIGAGENWDGVVARCVGMHISGIEAMSAIPGTAGATPIQNVGAYGQEIADTLISLEAFDRQTNKIITLQKADCKFSYRDSIFKHQAKDRYVIASIALKLSKKDAKVPEYPGVRNYFEQKNITDPSLAEIRDAIITIRATKLPDPKVIASVGSFFKNPIVDKSLAEKIKKENPSVVVFPIDDTHSKVGAGSLLESLGFRGKNFGNLSLYSGNALVIVNNGKATHDELLKLKDHIIGEVREKFDIRLEPEPIFIDVV